MFSHLIKLGTGLLHVDYALPTRKWACKIMWDRLGPLMVESGRFVTFFEKFTKVSVTLVTSQFHKRNRLITVHTTRSALQEKKRRKMYCLPLIRMCSNYLRYTHTHKESELLYHRHYFN